MEFGFLDLKSAAALKVYGYASVTFLRLAARVWKHPFSNGIIFKNLDVHSEHLNEPVPGFAEIDGSHTNLLDACYREICH